LVCDFDAFSIRVFAMLILVKQETKLFDSVKCWFYLDISNFEG